jgi:hypothetical protein
MDSPPQPSPSTPRLLQCLRTVGRQLQACLRNSFSTKSPPSTASTQPVGRDESLVKLRSPSELLLHNGFNSPPVPSSPMCRNSPSGKDCLHEEGEEQEEENKPYQPLEDDQTQQVSRHSARTQESPLPTVKPKPKTTSDRFFVGDFAESQRKIEKLIYANIARKKAQTPKIDVFRLDEQRRVPTANDDGLPRRMIDAIYINKFDGNRLLTSDQSKHECSICCTQFKDDDPVKTLQCLHSFHQQCIDEWFGKKSTCPDCKFNLRTLNITQLV